MLCAVLCATFRACSLERGTCLLGIRKHSAQALGRSFWRHGATHCALRGAKLSRTFPFIARPMEARCDTLSAKRRQDLLSSRGDRALLLLDILRTFPFITSPGKCQIKM